MKVRVLIFFTLFMISISTLVKAGEMWQMTLRQCLPVLLKTIDKEILNEEALNVQMNDENILVYAKGKGYFQGLPMKELDDPISSYYIARLVCNILQIPPFYSTYDGLSGIGDAQRAYAAALGTKQLWDITVGEQMNWDQWRGLLNRLNAYIEDGEKYLEREDVESFKQFAERLLEHEQKNNPLHRFSIGTVLGQVEETIFTTKINQLVIPTYLYKGRRWVNTYHLSMYGFDVRWDEETRTIYISRNITKETPGWNMEGGVIDFKGEKICYSNIIVYIGTRRIPSYNIQGWTMIPLDELSLFGMTQQEGDYISITLSDFTYDSRLFLEFEHEKWINKNLEKTDIELLHIWYDLVKEEYREDKEIIFGLEPDQSEYLSFKRFLWGKNEIYIGTIIALAGEHPNPYLEMDREYMYSKERLQLLTELDERRWKEEIINKVRPSIIIGTMKREVGIFKAGEKVEILYGEDGKWYECKSVTTGKQGRIPWGSVTIPKDPATNLGRMTAEELEWYVAYKEITSSTPYFVWTDLDRQLTYVFKKQLGKWKLIRTMLSSSGRNMTPTPRGFFQIQDRGAYFGKGYQAKNWVRIKGDYLYHSVLFDVSGRYLLERGVLGHRASQGCIRFSFEDSEWFYKTIPRGTAVWIY